MQEKSKTAETHAEPTATTPFFKDFFCPPDTDFADFLDETDRLADFAPGIIDKIHSDQTALGLGKKQLRKAEERFTASRTQCLEGFEDAGDGPEVSELDNGRPRMPARMVFMFILVRGFLGSVTSDRAVDRLRDSRSLDVWLAKRGWSLPARTTIYENINAVGDDTMALIHKEHLRMCRGEQLDDFAQTTIDSTSVEANSAWPTDPVILYGLLGRAHRIGRELGKYGLQPIPERKYTVWLRQLEKLPFRISLAAKKQKQLRKEYMELCETAYKMTLRLLRDLAARQRQWEQTLESGKLGPTMAMRARRTVDLLEKSILEAVTTLKQTHERVFEGRTSKARERVLSLNDEAAAFIQKGGREAVIGYKPQLCRSANGLITHVEVPDGNAADSGQLVSCVRASIERTGTVPSLVSADDGYASKAGVDALTGLGVETVSISGAKGRKLLGELWDEETYAEARRYRSSVESLMFCLKHSFHFGRCGRIGLAAVRRELAEKCQAYNLCRSILLRRRKREGNWPDCRQAA